MVAAAIVGGAVIGGVATSAGASKSAGAAKAGTDATVNESRRQFDLVRNDTAPIRALGNQATASLAKINSGDMSGFYASPDYQFNLDQGQKAIDRSASARAGLLSGGAEREGIKYASGLASGQFSGFVDRLMQQAGLGSTGIGASAAAGANAASTIGSAYMNGAALRGSAYNQQAAGINNAAVGAGQNLLLAKYLGTGG